ncbi:MAG TPA: endonuclease/exonuclease/phosphatase family protein [Candidatus Sulfotelmatobacter sp.]|nr:endonuclease/exonuclease/phosphatase family protein [Candidatus Sulfotelmatobacter sp.]
MEWPNVPPMDEVISGEFSSQRGRTRSRDSVRVVTWNIERGLQFSAILDFLRSADADLIMLQEVDLNARRTQHRDVAFELARSLGLNYIFGKKFLELGAGSGSLPAYQGVATLSQWPLTTGQIIRFQYQSTFWKPRWYVPQTELFQRRLGGRIALVTEALIHGQRFVIYNLHLESKGSDRLRLQQLQQVLEDAGRHTESSSVILGGDFNLNATNGEAGATLQRAGFRDAVRLSRIPTSVARLPFRSARCIDWIFVSDVSHGVHSTGQIHGGILASDHYPVSATIEIL